ncbi:MAG: STAS domain-containing protein [Gemmatimonadetes bacterium]|nr:STAS domain-containing protein [Gemmatimonadota bacterium]
MAFECSVENTPDEVRMKLTGALDASSAPQFKQAVESVAGTGVKRLALFMEGLEFMASAGLRVLIFAKQKMGSGVAIYVVGATGPVLNTLTMSGFHQSVFVQDTYEPE